MGASATTNQIITRTSVQSSTSIESAGTNAASSNGTSVTSSSGNDTTSASEKTGRILSKQGQGGKVGTGMANAPNTGQFSCRLVKINVTWLDMQYVTSSLRYRM